MDGDEQLQNDERGKPHEGRGEKHGAVRGGGDDGLLAAELEEIIERLQYGRTDALLHARDELAVDAGEQQTHHKAEQEAGEDEDIADVLKSSQNYCHYSHLLKERSG